MEFELMTQYERENMQEILNPLFARAKQAFTRATENYLELKRKGAENKEIDKAFELMCRYFRLQFHLKEAVGELIGMEIDEDFIKIQ